MTKQQKAFIATLISISVLLAMTGFLGGTSEPEPTYESVTASATTTTVNSDQLQVKQRNHEIATWNAAVEKHNVNTWVWITTTRMQQQWIDATNKRLAEEEAQRRAAAERSRNVSSQASSSSSRSEQAAPSGSGVCNGIDLPPCYVVQRESGFNPTAKNPSSSACGLYQFINSTWANFQGYPNACSAPVSVQVAKARILWDHGRGCSHWSAC